MASFVSLPQVPSSSLEAPRSSGSGWRKKGLSVDVSLCRKTDAVAIPDGDGFLEREESISKALNKYLTDSGRYQAHSIGKGKFSNVYKLEPVNRDEKHPDVIKIFYQYEPFKLFRGEYLANKIDSPYFLKAECLFYQDGKIVNEPASGALEVGVILPYVEGKTLKELIEAGAIDANQALAIVSQIALALKDLKPTGIAHRDLKPDNIMIKSGGSIVILDFGISRQYPSSGFETPIGTEAFMAPERDSGATLEGLGIEKSDVYSLGRIFLHMLGGKISADFWERFGQPDLTGTPEKFHEVLQAMLQPKPELRASVDQVIEMLSDLSKNAD